MIKIQVESPILALSDKPAKQPGMLMISKDGFVWLFETLGCEGFASKLNDFAVKWIHRT